MTTEDKIELLKTKRSVAYQHLVNSHQMSERAKKLYESLLKRYLSDKQEYESTDRQLAMLDGRFKVEEPATKSRKSKEVNIDLTREQVERIAKELGIELPIVEEVPEPNEVVLQEDDEELG